MRKIMEALIVICVLIPMVFAATGEASNPPPPHFTLNTTAVTLCRGITNIIPLNLTNLDNSNLNQIQDAQFSISGVKGAYATETYAPNTVNATKSVITDFPVFISANASSFLSIPISVNFYYFAEEYTDSEIRNLTFSVETCPMPLSLSISPTVLGAGSYENLTINMTNTGATPLNYTTLRFSFPGQDAALIGNPQIKVDSISPESTVYRYITIYVSKNATPNFDANVTANFYNGTSLEELSQSVAMIATGIINITPSSFTVSPSLPTAGSIFSLSFVLTNVGTSSASAVAATVIPPKGFTAYGTNSTFIGDIGVDTQTPVTLSMLTSNTLKSGTYKVPIRLNYLNNLRQNVTVWANTSVMIGQGAINATELARFRGSQSSGIPWLVILLLIIIAALGVMLYKERKKRRSK